jgi:hypothetical protein
MSLSVRISELVVALRTKLNTMTPRLLPEGGTDGQVLVKGSDTDFVTEWADFGGWAPILFTGTGAPQQITLPEACAITDIMVFVDGVFQYSGYSISGNVLTTNQPLGAEGIILRYGAGVRGPAANEVSVENVIGLAAALATKANVNHEHSIDDIIGLADELEALVSAIQNAGNQTYVWNAPSSTTSWLISHNLGRYPSVTTVDSAGTEFKGTVSYIDINTLRVDFAFATGGKAYLV